MEGREYSLRKFNLTEFISENRLALSIFLGGLLVLFLGIFLAKGDFVSGDKVEVLESPTESQNASLIVEVAGEVVSPGVYEFGPGARVDEVLIKAGGLTAAADRNWVEKNLNRAAKISDGQKIYIPGTNEEVKGVSADSSGVYQSDTELRGSGTVNINTGSQSELESLNGIGPVYAQKIIEQRPYSNIEELLTKSVIPKSAYEKIKDEISVF